MKKVISVSFGEVALKGDNRGYFERQLINRIRAVLKNFQNVKVTKDQGKIYVDCNEDDIETAIDKVRKVFGIVYVSPCYMVEKNMEDIREGALKVMELIKGQGNLSYKVLTKRADKNFEYTSPEISRDVGGYVLNNLEGVKVDLHNPDKMLYVDIRTKAYIYTEKVKGYGGLPVGTNGRGLLLLSGGIDSPVAGFLMAKRGVQIDAVHFHSYPFTSERAEEKVKDLAKIISVYCGNMNLHSVNILNIQKEINKNCPEDEMTIISRRFMMRIAEKIANKNGINALITGESLGQVASQTIYGLNVTNSSVNLPVFRPLIGMDKTDIMDISRDIETYETSILPFDDCCTVFLPKHPVTRPRVEDIEKSEESLDIELLVSEAVKNAKCSKIKIG